MSITREGALLISILLVPAMSFRDALPNQVSLRTIVEQRITLLTLLAPLALLAPLGAPYRTSAGHPRPYIGSPCDLSPDLPSYIHMTLTYNHVVATCEVKLTTQRYQESRTDVDRSFYLVSLDCCRILLMT